MASLGKAQDAVAERVAVVVVVKEPAIKGMFAKRGLDCFKLHGEILLAEPTPAASSI
jgi:hypothetical protein